MARRFHEETGFSQFSELPNELQIQIWEMTVEPRRVPVYCRFGDTRAPSPSSDKHSERNMRRYMDEATRSNKTTLPNVIYAASYLKPAILDVCQQSRAIAQRIYTALELTPLSGVSYAWLQLEIDTVYIDLKETSFGPFWRCGASIQRLEFEADISEEFWCRNGYYDLMIFRNLVHCTINTNDYLSCWGDADGDNEGRPGCNPENIWIRHIETGEMRSCAELDREAVILRGEEENMGVEWNN